MKRIYACSIFSFQSMPNEQSKPQIDPTRAKTSWVHSAEQKQQTPVAQEHCARKFPFDVKKIALYALVFFAIAGIGFLAVNVFLHMGQQDAVSITASGPQSVQPGATTTFTVTIHNIDRSNALSDIAIATKADAGTVFPEKPLFATTQRLIDNLQPNQEHTETFSAVFWGKQNDARTIDVTVWYKLGTLSTRFQKTISYTPHIASDVVFLHMSVPEQVLPDQQFSFSASYANIGTARIGQGTVRIEFPEGFAVSKIDPDMKQDGTARTAAFAQLEPKAETIISVQGVIASSAGQGKQITMRVTTLVRNVSIELGAIQKNVLVISSPLTLSISVNNKPDYALSLGEIAQYTLTFQNNSSVSLKDVVIMSDVSNPWFLLDTMQARNGSFSSKDKTITWNGGTVPALLVVNPGQSGAVSFSVKIRQGFTQGQINNTVAVHADISAPNTSQNIGTAIASQANIVSKIQGMIGLTATVWYRDPYSSGFAQSGPMPLRVNQTTAYSVHMRVSVQANDFRDISVQTVLPAGVSCSGNVKGDAQGFLCNPRTNEIVWTIPSISAYTEKELIVQVNVVPSVDQVGRTIPILGQATSNATDAFTQTVVSQHTQGIMSDLPDDSSVDAITGRVSL